MMKDDERELLRRLQMQFGDMDVEGTLLASGHTIDNNNDSDSESSSSIEEPTAEELRIWQEAQYEKGRKSRQEGEGVVNEDVVADAMKNNNSRRFSLCSRRRHEMMISSSSLEARECWVVVPSDPDLGSESSSFFPTVVVHGDNNNTNNNNHNNCHNNSTNGKNEQVRHEQAEGVMVVNPLLQKLVEEDHEVLGTKWTRLFSSSEGDGLSFRTLCEKIRGYDGPTILLIRGIPSASKEWTGHSSTVGHDRGSDSGVSLGFYTIDSWMESKEYCGLDNCFLFALDYKNNNVQIVRPKKEVVPSVSHINRRYMFCQTSSMTKTSSGVKDEKCMTNGSVRGMGIGGTASQPRVHLTESLEECRALPFDSLFEDGDLLLGKCDSSLFYFDVECIEVWAVGGEEWISDALHTQKQAKQLHDANLKRAQRVEKAYFLDDFRTGLTCVSKGLFGHRDLVTERCDL